MTNKKKKKDTPPFDRAACCPRLPDDILCELVKIQLSSAACQNKGFILEGYPRSQEDAKAIFMEKKELPKKAPEGEEAPAEGEEEPQFEYIINEKIIP